MFSNQSAQTGRLRAGIFERFDFAHSHHDIEFFAFQQCTFGVGSTGLKSLPDDFACEFGIEHSSIYARHRQEKAESFVPVAALQGFEQVLSVQVG